MIKLSEIEKTQSKWGNGIVKIGSLKSDRKACEKATIEMLNELYAFDLGDVLFKPTKAEKKQFRLELDGAKSYFIGGNIKFDEDKGFALLPWQSVKFENASVVLNKSHALAMGNYFFTDSSGTAVKVEYTFGYIRTNNGALKINLHHSSLPYKND
ncbi:MAG: hypothetical protein P8I26_02005 [Flavobacteriaceae bacterium]|nr:hypothetical protein [Flavobacteriaceae bacterium]